jgi:hypothetical protein
VRHQADDFKLAALKHKIIFAHARLNKFIRAAFAFGATQIFTRNFKMPNLRAASIRILREYE